MATWTSCSYYPALRFYPLQVTRYWIDNLDMLLEELFGPGCDGVTMDTPSAIVEMKFNQ